MKDPDENEILRQLKEKLDRLIEFAENNDEDFASLKKFILDRGYILGISLELVKKRPGNVASFLERLTPDDLKFMKSYKIARE